MHPATSRQFIPPALLSYHPKPQLQELVCTCNRFAWQCFVSWEATGSGFYGKSWQKLPSCPTEPASSKTDPLLAKAEPITNCGCASGIMYLRSRGKRTVVFSLFGIYGHQDSLFHPISLLLFFPYHHDTWTSQSLSLIYPNNAPVRLGRPVLPCLILLYWWHKGNECAQHSRAGIWAQLSQFPHHRFPLSLPVHITLIALSTASGLLL